MKTKTPKDPLKAARKGSRDAEIGMYDHPLPRHKVHRSKKQYDRKTAKARLKKGEPLFCDAPRSVDKNHEIFWGINTPI